MVLFSKLVAKLQIVTADGMPFGPHGSGRVPHSQTYPAEVKWAYIVETVFIHYFCNLTSYTWHASYRHRPKARYIAEVSIWATKDLRSYNS